MSIPENSDGDLIEMTPSMARNTQGSFAGRIAELELFIAMYRERIAADTKRIAELRAEHGKLTEFMGALNKLAEKP